MLHVTRLRRRAWLALMMAAPLARAEDAPVERWIELTPPGWNPYDKFNPLQLGRIQDGTPESVQLMQRIREALDTAPTVAELEGRMARLPGFVVPLESSKEGVSEFLLVPYFGACIHTPPPPANQIIVVRPKSARNALRTMDAVRVSGRLHLARQGSASGESGYRIDEAEIQKLR